MVLADKHFSLHSEMLNLNAFVAALIFMSSLFSSQRTLYNDDFFPDIVSSGIPSLYYQNPKLSRFNVALWLSRGVEGKLMLLLHQAST